MAVGNATTRALTTLRLMQLSSPALPIGAFAYSQGMEQAAARGWVDEQSLQGWLHGRLLNCVAGTDLPLLERHHRAWQRGDIQEAWRWSRVVHAMRDTAELQREEQHLGSALARLLCHLGMAQAQAFQAHPEVSYVGMYALAAVTWEIEAGDAMAGFAFAWLEGQLGAAARLLPLGQLAAQTVLSSLLPAIDQAVSKARELKDDEIGYLAQGVSMASSWHEQQYSRLFRS